MCEIGDDMDTYEKDILNDTMNSYRNFVMLYGAQAQERMREFLEQHVRDYVTLRHSAPDGTPRMDRYLMKTLEHPDLDPIFARSLILTDGHFSCGFSVPDPILDEHSFREHASR